MFKKNTGLKDTPLLISAQGIHWSRQRLLAVASQLSMLVITVILITNVLITLGERRLQEEWAVQRYSELQTVGALLADKISFQQFRTQMFAKSEYLRQYLDNPGHKEYQRLMTSWDSLKRSTPELLDLALFDADGKFRIATSNTFGSMSMPPALLGNKRNLGGRKSIPRHWSLPRLTAASSPTFTSWPGWKIRIRACAVIWSPTTPCCRCCRQ